MSHATAGQVGQEGCRVAKDDSGHGAGADTLVAADESVHRQEVSVQVLGGESTGF